MTRPYDLAILPGDGIGPEVIAEGLRVLEAAAKAVGGVDVRFREYPAGADCYRRTGDPLPAATREGAAKADAILLGACGLPDVRMPDGTEIAPQITLRFDLDLYAGVRPVKLYRGLEGPLRGKTAIDYVIIRENTEGLFASFRTGIVLRDEVAVDSLIITRRGTARVVRYAFELAARRSGGPLDGTRRVTCVDKSNVFKSFALFRKVYGEVAQAFPAIARDYAYIDATCLYLIQRPEFYDVLVTENQFGDIISDLAAATVGGMGMAPSADIGDDHAVFQPAHGTAPAIAGQGIANPMATLLSAAMMCDWLGRRNRDQRLTEARRRIETAVEGVLAEGRLRTPDIGGTAKTDEVGRAVADRIR